jgi:hypothetical protein
LAVWLAAALAAAIGLALACGGDDDDDDNDTAGACAGDGESCVSLPCCAGLVTTQVQNGANYTCVCSGGGDGDICGSLAMSALNCCADIADANGNPLSADQICADAAFKACLLACYSDISFAPNCSQINPCLQNGDCAELWVVTPKS